MFGIYGFKPQGFNASVIGFRFFIGSGFGGFRAPRVSGFERFWALRVSDFGVRSLGLGISNLNKL